MANKVLVFIEQRQGKINKASYEAVKVANDIASNSGMEVLGVAVGNDINDLDKSGGFGLTKIMHYKGSELENYSSAYKSAVLECIKENEVKIFVAANTTMAKDLAPRIAAKMDAAIAADCVNFVFDGGDITATRPIYAGKALLDVKLKKENKVFTVRPNVFNAGEPNGDSAEIVVKEISSPDLSMKVTELSKSDGKLDVAEAEIIVSGGRGMKAPENFNIIEDLAESLGAAVGASRAVVDAGWRPHAEQVGQTGKTVSPQLYVAVGISGAIQHLAGMRSSKYIVAINKDKDAPIFQVADYGIVGDAFEIAPALTQEIKKLKS